MLTPEWTPLLTVIQMISAVAIVASGSGWRRPP